MKKLVAPLWLVGMTALLHAAPPQQPQAIRTYVSAQGKDSNPCSLAKPCRNLQAAVTQTAPGGEVYVLNTAGYGTVTITTSISLVSEGASSGVLAPSGGAAVTINAGPNDVVNLRGLDIFGAGSGAVGVQFNSGQALSIENSSIRGFTSTGINFVPKVTGTSSLYVGDTVVSNNGNNGILIAPSGSGTVNGALKRIVTNRNGLASSGIGIFVYGGSSTGPLNVTVADIVAGGNYYGIGAGSANIMIRNSTISNNIVGIRADQAATVLVGQSTITGNGTGWTTTNGGVLGNYGNNTFNGNVTDGAPPSPVSLK